MFDLKEKLNEHLLKLNKEKEEQHTRSGLLSASRLGKSTLENCLSLLDVKGMELTPYSLGVFARGNQVEDWLIEQFTNMGIVERTQEEIKYTTPDGYPIIGFEDVKLKDDKMPTEIKSIKNSQFKYLDLEGARTSYRLQGAVYALAGGYDTFRILYVSAEDFRLKEFIYRTADYKDLVDERARLVYQALESGVLPQFKPLDEFMSKEQYTEYTAYPEWFGEYEVTIVEGSYTLKTGLKRKTKKEVSVLKKAYSVEQIMRMLEVEHPKAFNKLKKGDFIWRK